MDEQPKSPRINTQYFVLDERRLGIPRKCSRCTFPCNLGEVIHLERCFVPVPQSAAMDAMETTSFASGPRVWRIVGRWQEYDGEARANLLRIVAVGAFYGVELLRFHWFDKAAGDAGFHRQATVIAAAWTLVALVVLLCRA